MASDIFLKLDGITGEAEHLEHKGEIEVLGWSWSLVTQNHGSMAGSGVHRPGFHELTLTKPVDQATAALWYHCASGKHVARAVLTVRDDTVGSVPVLQIELGDVRIISVGLVGDTAGERPSENVHLGFGLVELRYTPLSTAGTPGTPQRFRWDVRTHSGGLG